MRSILTLLAVLSVLLFAAAVFEAETVQNTYTPAVEVVCGDLCE